MTRYAESSTLPPLVPAPPLSHYSTLFLHNQYNSDHYSPHVTSARPDQHHSRNYISPLYAKKSESMNYWNMENPVLNTKDFSGKPLFLLKTSETITFQFKIK